MEQAAEQEKPPQGDQALSLHLSEEQTGCFFFQRRADHPGGNVARHSAVPPQNRGKHACSFPVLMQADVVSSLHGVSLFRRVDRDCRYQNIPVRMEKLAIRAQHGQGDARCTPQLFHDNFKPLVLFQLFPKTDAESDLVFQAPDGHAGRGCRAVPQLLVQGRNKQRVVKDQAARQNGEPADQRGAAFCGERAHLFS